MRKESRLDGTRIRLAHGAIMVIGKGERRPVCRFERECLDYAADNHYVFNCCECPYKDKDGHFEMETSGPAAKGHVECPDYKPTGAKYRPAI